MVGKYTEKEFDKHDYDEFYENHHFQPLREDHALAAHEIIPRFGWAFDKVEELKPQTLLDLGCLDGSFGLTIAKHLGVDVTGVDLTKDGIAIATERAEKHDLPAIFHQGKIEDWLQFYAKQGKTFDVVTCFEVLEHVDNPAELIKLIDEVLAPGGSVLISTPSFESPIWGADDEANKCHVRLYTMEDKDYEKVNKYGTLRKATSISKEIGKNRIKEMGIYSELINVWYQ